MGLSIPTKFGKIQIRTVDVKPGMDVHTHTQTDRWTELNALSPVATPYVVDNKV
jgi:hypothetical protein